MKRILAFVLAASMLLGNTTTAFATTVEEPVEIVESVENIAYNSNAAGEVIYKAYFGMPEELNPTAPTNTSSEWTGHRIVGFGEQTGYMLNSNEIDDNVWKVLDASEGLILADGVTLGYGNWNSIVGDAIEGGLSSDLEKVDLALDMWAAVKSPYGNDRYHEVEYSAINDIRLLTKNEMMTSAYGFGNQTDADKTRTLKDNAYYYQLNHEDSNLEQWVQSSTGAIIETEDVLEYTDNVGFVPAIELDVDDIFMTIRDREAEYGGYTRAEVTDPENWKWNIVFKSDDEGFFAEIPTEIAYDSYVVVKVAEMDTNYGYNRIGMTISDQEGNILVYKNTELSENENKYYLSVPSELNSGKYQLKVFAENAGYDGYANFISNVVEGELKISGPEVTELEITKNDYGCVRLNWEIANKRTENPQTYTYCNIYRSSEESGVYELLKENEACDNSDPYYYYDDKTVNYENDLNTTYYYKVCISGTALDDAEVVTNAGMYYGTAESENGYIGMYFVDTDGNKVDSLTLEEGESKRLNIALIKNDGTEEILTTVEAISANWRIYDNYHTTEKFQQNLYTSNDIQTDTSKLDILPSLWSYDKENSYVNFYLNEVYVQAKEGGTGNYYLMTAVSYDKARWHWQIPVLVEQAEENAALTQEYTEGLNHIFTNQDSMNQKIRTDMVNRVPSDVYLISEAATEELHYFAIEYPQIIYDFDAEREGMKPYEGEYIYWHNTSPTDVVSQSSSWTFGQSGFNGQNWNFISSDKQEYMTTVKQEQWVNEALDKLMWQEGGALYKYKDSPRYEKVKAALNYVKNSVKYIGTPQPKYHSCYSALHDKTGTCQAYSLLFGRILREWGIANKIIMGTDKNAHTYNIVEMNGVWYYCDPSAGILLKGENNFSRTAYQDLFTSEKFVENYISKISKTDYVAPFIYLYGNDVFLGEYGSVQAAVTAMEADAEIEGNIGTAYEILLSNNATIKGEEFNLSENITSFVLDLNGKQLKVSENTTFSLDKIENGKIVIGAGKNVTVAKSMELSNVEISGTLTIPTGIVMDLEGKVIFDEVIVENNYNETVVELKQSEGVEIVFNGKIKRTVEGEQPLVKFTKDKTYVSGEKIAVVNVDLGEEPEKLFVLDNELSVVHRDKQLIAAKVVLNVQVNEYPELGSKEYISLEEAIDWLKTDFKEKAGTYRFYLADDVALSKDVTLPSYVKTAQFVIGSKGDGKEVSFELNEKMINTPGIIRLESVVSDVYIPFNGTLKAKELSIENGIWNLKKIANLTNLNVKSGGQLILNEYTQGSEGKVSLETGAVLYINENCVLYNVSLNGTGNEGANAAIIYRAPEAQLSINGKFVRSSDELILKMAVLTEKATAEFINNPCIKGTKGKLFATSIKAFPLTWIEILQPESEQEYCVAYQQDQGVYAGKEWFSLKQTDGEKEDALASFAKWSDAVTYINELKNKNAAYVIEISESVDLNEAMTMPTTLSSLTVRGKDSIDGISITYVGDVKLTSPTTFENLKFSAKKYNSKTKDYDSYVSILNLNNKNVTFANCDGIFASVTSGTKSLVMLEDTKMNVTKTVTFKDLVMKNVKFSTDSLTVSNLLTMESAEITCTNKITLKDIKTEDGNNLLSYAENSTKKNTLVINGTISAENLGTTETNGITFRQNAVTLQMKKVDGTDVEFGQDTFLCKVPKAGAGWFKVGSEPDVSGTYKKGDFIYCGDAVENVKLYSSVTGDAEYIWESSFATLNEALTEIDKLGIATQYYKVELVNSEVNADGNVYSSKKTTMTSPSKAVNVIVTTANGDLMPIFFKGNLTLKTNMTLKNIVLEPAAKYSISLGNFALTLDNCIRNEMLLSGISGSGIAKNSALYLIDTNLCVNGAVNNVGKIGFDSTIAEKASLTVEGKINIGDVLLYKDGYLTGLASVTRKNGTVTKVVSQITINGQVYDKNQSEDSVLYLDYLEYLSKKYEGFDFTQAQNVLDSGFDAAKALKVNYEHIQLKQLKETAENHNLIKSKGNLLYFDGSPAIKLIYEDENQNEIISYCRNFADAVTDINNQKEQREYRIYLLENVGVDTPATLTMPNKNYVSELTIVGNNCSIGYLGNLSFTSDVILEEVRFVQMLKVDGVYIPSDEAKDDYPSAVSVTTSYDVKIIGDVSFNTPLNLNGSKKGTLTLDNAGNLYTVTNEKNDSRVILGSINNFKEVKLNGYILDIVPYYTNADKTKYTVPTVSVTDLKIDGGSLSVEGKLNLANVWMDGLNPTIAATLDFNITGALNVNSDNAKLSTYAKAVNKEPYLKVTGNVIREDKYNPVEIEVFENKDEHRNLTCGTGAKSTLLTVKNAQAYHFKPHNDNDSTDGNYMLVKSGAKICLNIMDNAVVYLYEGDPYDSKWRGAYLTYGEAATAIDAIKNKDAEYTYLLVKDIGEISKPISVTIPSQASRVVIQSKEDLPPVAFYVKGNISLKTHTEFRNIRFAPVNKSKGTAMSFASGNFDLTLTDINLQDSMTMSIKDITGGGKQTIILDSENLLITGKINKTRELVVNENATVNGAVTTEHLKYGSEDIKLIVNGVLKVKYPENH